MRTLAFFFLLLPATSFSTDIQARIDHCVFYNPEIGSYVETYLHFSGSSLKYKVNENGIPQANLSVTQIIALGDSVVDFRKVSLKGPELIDSVAEDIRDQQRFLLSPGKYTLEVSVIDDNRAEANAFKFSQVLEVKDVSKGIQISDVELLESITDSETKSLLTKGGKDLVPLVDNFYPPELDRIAYYVEIYNSKNILGEEGQFLLKTELRRADNDLPMSNFGRVKKLNTREVVPAVQIINIESLPTGDYYMVLSLINRNNKEIASRKVFVQRLNPVANLNTEHLENLDIQMTFVRLMDNEDTLSKYISSLRPIASGLELNIMDVQLLEFDMSKKQKFFYAFWQNRQPDNPEEAWRNYQKKLVEAQKLYGTALRPGWDTDRGRLFLKYGKPDYVESRPNEPSAYPYEIWQYYKIAQFTNRVFIFYSPNMVRNDYVLLHSDMRGEVRNNRWKMELHRRTNPFGAIDDEDNLPHFGGRSSEVFNRGQ